MKNKKISLDLLIKKLSGCDGLIVMDWKSPCKFTPWPQVPLSTTISSSCTFLLFLSLHKQRSVTAVPQHTEHVLASTIAYLAWHAAQKERVKRHLISYLIWCWACFCWFVRDGSGEWSMSNCSSGSPRASHKECGGVGSIFKYKKIVITSVDFNCHFYE